jgi:hypothetical protein
MTSRPNATQMELARRLLAREGLSDGGAAEEATAAERVYDKLSARLAVLLGPLGVRALFARSARLVEPEYPRLAELATIEGVTNLRGCLQTLDPAVATETAVALFGTFLALVTTFVGDRLTTELLRGAWPMIEEPPPAEEKK